MSSTENMRLTKAERSDMNCDCGPGIIHSESCFVPVVESIIAARLSNTETGLTEGEFSDLNFFIDGDVNELRAFVESILAARLPATTDAEWDGTNVADDSAVVNAIPPEMRAVFAADVLTVVERIAKRHHDAGYRAGLAHKEDE